jgi:hypothetical protein
MMEVDLVLRHSRKMVQYLDRIVLAAVEAAIDERLQAPP